MLSLAISSGDCSYSEWIMRVTILETVYVIKTIQGFFDIFLLVCFAFVLSEDKPNDVRNLKKFCQII